MTDLSGAVMLNPRAVIESGDAYALKILEESRNVPMPTLTGMTRQRAEYFEKLKRKGIE